MECTLTKQINRVNNQSLLFSLSNWSRPVLVTPAFKSNGKPNEMQTSSDWIFDSDFGSDSIAEQEPNQSTWQLYEATECASSINYRDHELVINIFFPTSTIWAKYVDFVLVCKKTSWSWFGFGVHSERLELVQIQAASYGKGQSIATLNCVTSECYGHAIFLTWRFKFHSQLYCTFVLKARCGVNVICDWVLI